MKYFIAIMLIIGIGSGIWLGLDAQRRGTERALERYEYEGRVTATEYSEYYTETTVWLNSELQAIEIDGSVTLAIGEEYLIIIDGNGNLINAILQNE